MEVFHGCGSMQQKALELRRTRTRVGFVPTMGALHAGHLSLVEIARRNADLVVVSIFVNPTQFGPNEDLDRYPRTQRLDEDLLREAGVDILFLPETSSMYERDHTVYVCDEQLSGRLCGASRPGHFRGVLTVVAKLFNLVLPDLAVFGEKDAQQLRLIRRMVRDLNIPVTLLSGPTIREADGLAMSSRNANLSAAERAQAICLHQALGEVQKAFNAGERRAAALKDQARTVLARATLAEVDYIAVVDDATLDDVEVLEHPTLVALAVQFPGARLIDNRVLLP